MLAYTYTLRLAERLNQDALDITVVRTAPNLDSEYLDPEQGWTTIQPHQQMRPTATLNGAGLWDRVFVQRFGWKGAEEVKL